jgi:glycosyltransferase involved in cell wall biosynthesis
VAPGVHDRWDETHVVARRIGGALAHEGSVSIFVPGTSTTTWVEGLLEIRQFVHVPPSAHRAYVLEHALVAPSATGEPATTPSASRRRLEEELFLARGEHCPQLVEELAAGDFDVVVLVGATSGHVTLTSRALPDHTKVFVSPLPRSRDALGLSLALDVLERADVIMTTTVAERVDVEAAMIGRKPVTTRHIGFVARTNALASAALPTAFPAEATVVAAADWTRVEDRRMWERWCELLTIDLGRRVNMRAVGPAANRLGPLLAGESSPSRLDVWRWMSHSIAVVDPMTYSPIGIPVIEALTFGVPVIACATSGAPRHHAETADSGLWFRSYGEFLGCVQLLLERPTVAEQLGLNGQAYVSEAFGSTEHYVANVLDAVSTVS